MKQSRRKFIKSMAAAGVVLSIPGRSVFGANDRLSIAVIGTNGRGSALANDFALTGQIDIVYICDVDARVRERTIENIRKIKPQNPKGLNDFRKALDDPEIDAVVIATPDHWQTSAAILALKAGKHVYVEKPGSHDPAEAKLITAAQAKYKRLVQMGNQQRSSPQTRDAIREIHEGIIGNAYYGRSWYANTRKSIGTGKAAPVPEWLDYELWQGPAPRREYKDNLIHYNWHWFWNWGTGETCNNATHELDVCRWALQVEFPNRVSSTGGRFHFNDDWQAFDTQIAGFDFPENKSITWEGRSCNGFPVMNRGRGATIHGDKGTVLIDRGGYTVYDLDNNPVKTVTAEESSDGMNITSAQDPLNHDHIMNFINAIRTGSELNSPIAEGQKSSLLCHLANIAQRTGRSLDCDPKDGLILGDVDAMKLWQREYEPGWEPTI